MMSTSQTPTAIERNNFAASQIEVGNYNAAIQTLTTTLKTTLLAASHGYPLQEPSEMSLDECLNRKFQVSPHDCSNRYVYRRPIRIPFNLLDSNNTRTLIMSSAVIIIFNLALAHQLLSESTEQNQRKILHKAAKLYELGFQLQQLDNRLEPSVFFTMVILNNMGVVYDQLNDRATSAKYFEQLLSCLMVLTAEQNLVICESVDGFLRNVSSAHQCGLASAA
jgi:hypothetical protein